MEPEGVVHVLRRLLAVLVPGGTVVDLLAVPPNARVEIDGEATGELDESAFFPRALAAAAGLSALVREGLLAGPLHEERFPVLVRYPTGPDAVEDVRQRTYTRMPRELESTIGAVPGPVGIRETSLVRTFAASRRGARQ
jgi:hypothetical protein